MELVGKGGGKKLEYSIFGGEQEVDDDIHIDDVLWRAGRFRDVAASIAMAAAASAAPAPARLGASRGKKKFEVLLTPGARFVVLKKMAWDVELDCDTATLLELGDIRIA